MKRSMILALVLAFAPIVAAAQVAPAPSTASEPAGRPALTPQQQAALQQLRTQFQQTRLQTRANLLGALTPAHRTTIANVVGQLAITANPNPRAAAQALDGLLSPTEKQSILTIAAAARNSMRALMQQQRAIFAATQTPAQQAQMAQRQAYMQSHPHPAYALDPGVIVLRALGSFGGPGPGGMHERLM